MEILPKVKPPCRANFRPVNLNRKLPLSLPSLPSSRSETAAPELVPLPSPHASPGELVLRIATLEKAMERKDNEVRLLQQAVEEAQTQNASAHRQLQQMQQQMTRLQAQQRCGNDEALDFQLVAKSVAEDSKFEFGKDKIDLSRIERNVDILNRVASDEGVIVKNNGMASLQTALPIEMCFHRNGIYVEDLNYQSKAGGMHKFLPYSSSLGQAFVGDLLRGYLPAEFQTLYPNGVRLKVVDNSSELYATGVHASKPSVAGSYASAVRVRRQTDPETGIPQSKVPASSSELNAPTTNLPIQLQCPSPPAMPRHSHPLSDTNRSPQASTHGGVDRGMDPRSKRPAYRPTCMSTQLPASAPSAKPVIMELDACQDDAQEMSICHIRIRSRSHTLLVHVPAKTTVADLKVTVGKAIGQETEAFELCTVKQQVLELTSTMVQAGVIPNGTLFAQPNRT